MSIVLCEYMTLFEILTAAFIVQGYASHCSFLVSLIAFLAEQWVALEARSCGPHSPEWSERVKTTSCNLMKYWGPLEKSFHLFYLPWGTINRGSVLTESDLIFKKHFLSSPSFCSCRYYIFICKIFILREKEREGEREGERNMSERH